MMKLEHIATLAVAACLMAGCQSFSPQSAKIGAMDAYISRGEWAFAFAAGEQDYGCWAYKCARSMGTNSTAYLAYLEKMVTCCHKIDETERAATKSQKTLQYEAELARFRARLYGSAASRPLTEEAIVSAVAGAVPTTMEPTPAAVETAPAVQAEPAGAKAKNTAKPKQQEKKKASTPAKKPAGKKGSKQEPKRYTPMFVS